ncbi:hypothetical protein F4604DRAFT_1744079 [Suillus subluteus]|nr:hypothetical protein F4604DRAFT_1744079 [Suillus subluteus]
MKYCFPTLSHLPIDLNEISSAESGNTSRCVHAPRSTYTAYQINDQQDWQNALRQFGFNLSPPLIELVQVKYGMSSHCRVVLPSSCHLTTHSSKTMLMQDIKASNVASHYGPTPGITGAFQNLDTDNDGWVQINYDQFMQTVLSLP